MGKAWIMSMGGLVVLAGCGTLLDIQPDQTVPNDDGGMPGSDGPSSEGAAPVDAGDAGDAADGGPRPTPCTQSAPNDSCVLATNLVNLGSIAAANGTVYFTKHEDPGGIAKVPAAGGAVGPFSVNLHLPAGLFATDTTLYWVTEGDDQIVRQDFGTTMPTATMNGAALPAAQTVAIGSETFWTIPGVGMDGGKVQATSNFNSGSAIVLGLTLPTAIAVDATYVYYAEKTSAGRIARVTHLGSTPIEASPVLSGVNAIALSGPTTNVVAVTSLDGVYRAGTQTDMDFKGPWVRVSPNKTGVGVVADASGTLYVLAADGTLEVILNVASPPITKMAIAGCTAGTALAQDPSYVYLACKDTIVRVPK